MTRAGCCVATPSPGDRVGPAAKHPAGRAGGRTARGTWLRLLLLGWCLLVAAPPAVAAGGRGAPPAITSLDQARDIDDPRALLTAADHYRDQGDLDLARELYALAVDKSELTRYLPYRPMLREALILERLGRFEEAAARYREGMADDIRTTMQVLRIASVHPERDALFAEAVADVRDRVARAQRGEQVPIYTTSTGATRYLEVIDDDDVVDRLIEAGGRLRYCYIDHLDLTAERAPELPEMIMLSRCIVGSIHIPDRDLGKLVLPAIVLGDVDVGKTWKGEVNRSPTIPASRIDELALKDGIFLGRVNLQDVTVTGRNAMAPLAVFEGEADFRDADFHGTADFRFSVFAAGANFKGAHMTDAVYFGHTRYLAPVSFRGMFSDRDVYFDSAVFEAAASFDRCEWVRGATFENSVFHGPLSMNRSQLGGRLNMSRAVFEDTVSLREMQLDGMDFMGAWLQGDTAIVDVRVTGKLRFSLDEITRSQHLDDPRPLLSLYRDYQGDQDAEKPLTTQNSYGVTSVDDLTARVDGNLSFANSVLEGFTIFERVRFGRPGSETTAEFYNTQFLGESHFERTTWYSVADFTTIFANELSLNEAVFHRALILDDANVRGRVTLTDAALAGGATISFFGAELNAFEIDRDQVVADDDWGWLWQASETHRLFYRRCADGEVLADAPQIIRMRRGRRLDDAEVREACADRLADELVALKQTFGDRAMTADEDWAYWWLKHTELQSSRRFGGPPGLAAWLVSWPVFELAFGWGVNLGNLGWTVLLVCAVFAWIYRRFCPDSIMIYNGDEVRVRDIGFWGLYYISLQSLGAFNTGWDFGEDDGRLQYLNTLETFIGVIILTFFVGAYTRMILA
ncbi:MAG: hypothetical protein D6798_20175 [Deltaproteobacteria bacterium]|nr:MAG: hypothetical protein D6798_20175 [Deltaproteobacteria bacterium]